MRRYTRCQRSTSVVPPDTTQRTVWPSYVKGTECWQNDVIVQKITGKIYTVVKISTHYSYIYILIYPLRILVGSYSPAHCSYLHRTLMCSCNVMFSFISTIFLFSKVHSNADIWRLYSQLSLSGSEVSQSNRELVSFILLHARMHACMPTRTQYLTI